MADRGENLDETVATVPVGVVGGDLGVAGWAELAGFREAVELEDGGAVGKSAGVVGQRSFDLDEGECGIR